MIRIDGMNAKQVKMLDKLWSLDTQEEVSAWFRTLSDADLQVALTLQEMILDAFLEESAETDTKLAQNMLRGIGVKC